MNHAIPAFALLAAFGAPALHAQAHGDRPTPQQLIDRATAQLDLSPQQQAELRALVERYAADETSSRWELAAKVEEILTEDQKASLIARRAARREQARAKRGQNGEARPGDRKRRPDGKRSRLGLSESQREQLEVHREAMRAQRETLRSQLQTGAITDAAFVERSKALRDQSKAAVQALLTPEQREQADRFEARREAERAARERVLQITPEQKEAFEAALVEAARSGERRRAHLAAQDILTEDQRQIVAVHRALAPRHRHQGHRKGRPDHRRGEADRGPSAG